MAGVRVNGSGRFGWAADGLRRAALITNPGGHVVEHAVSDRLIERIFEYRLGGTVRKDLDAESIFHPEDRERALRFIHRVMASEPAETREIRGVTRSGDTRIFEMRGMRISTCHLGLISENPLRAWSSRMASF